MQDFAKRRKSGVGVVRGESEGWTVRVLLDRVTPVAHFTEARLESRGPFKSEDYLFGFRPPFVR
jgi:hypothetical protein